MKDVVTNIILKAAELARRETSNEPEPDVTKPAEWPIQCTVGPGLEGAIACESKIGYVNGSKGWLIYRGYDIFDLCAYSTFEEVSYLLLHGELPTKRQFQEYNNKLKNYRHLNKTLRLLMGFPVESMNAMGALRLGTNLMRQEFTYLDSEMDHPLKKDTIGSDEDSIAMETAPQGGKQATFEIKLRNLYQRAMKVRKNTVRKSLDEASGVEACYHLIAGVATITAAISRIHQQFMPLEPDPNLSHAGNILYMMTGKRPSSIEERIMDVALILHADHGMNASTFATMVVASTLSDFYFSVGSGIAALNGPLHGGANEQVIKILNEIGSVEKVKPWVDRALSTNNKISGFGHRVYKAYDPRARILAPLAEFLVKDNPRVKHTYDIAKKLEEVVVHKLGSEKKIFPNVDFYSGIVYSCLGIPLEMFTPIFAVSRVSGWTARTLEYKENNRIFRPRALYTGEFNKQYVPPGNR
ncbi:MAG TPA: citrate/2-methylcitrate synthase [Spirochaetota bacterium]|nr:citrate/2-methylcitrate synthase [Spirochaetota bacterium]HPJ39439.1 citrate/2-methylcitrate synthase [Spirochaetota bacterium]